jgi:hypothetical protein
MTSIASLFTWAKMSEVNFWISLLGVSTCCGILAKYDSLRSQATYKCCVEVQDSGLHRPAYRVEWVGVIYNAAVGVGFQ